jgi:hypothetical protein
VARDFGGGGSRRSRAWRPTRRADSFRLDRAL